MAFRPPANGDFCYNKPLSALQSKYKFCSHMRQTAASKPKFSKCKWKILTSNPKKAILHIHSLTKLYESIPDYMELSHLSGKDFYSTLASLRYNYHKLKDKELRFCKPRWNNSPEDSIRYHPNHNVKNSDSEKICQSVRRRNTASIEQCNHTCDLERNIQTKKPQQRSNSSMRKKIHTINSGLKDLTINGKMPSEEASKISKKLDRQNEQIRHPVSCDKEFLNVTQRSSYCNYLSVKAKSKLNTSQNNADKKSNIVKSTFKPASVTGSHSPKRILSNTSSKDQFETKKLKDNNSVSDITVNAANASDKAESDTASSVTKNHQKQKSVKAPFKTFNIDCNVVKGSKATRCISAALHPAARPNLAATLRFEYCKNKFAALKDLKHCNSLSNWKCNKFDWEVRKSPAWKSLLFDESHKDILAMRLASRKAEQALQHREHQLDMELMRERVKSSPLLLEGATFWTSSINTQNTHQPDKYIPAEDCKTLIPKCGKKCNRININNNKTTQSLNFTNTHLPKCKQFQFSTLKYPEDVAKSEVDSCLRIDNESTDDLSSSDRALL